MKSGTDSSPCRSFLQGKVGQVGEWREEVQLKPLPIFIHSMALLPVLGLRFGVARKNSRRITHLC